MPVDPAASRDLSWYQTAGANAIQARNTRLENLQQKLATAPADAGQNTALAAQLQQDVSGLQSLQTKLGSETSADAAHVDYKQIFDSFRVFKVESPKANQILADDRLTAEASKLQQSEARLTAKAGADPTAAESALLGDLKTEITQLTSGAQAQASAVIGLQPDQGVSAVEQANASALAAGSTAVSSLTDLRGAAAADVKQLHNLLDQHA